MGAKAGARADAILVDDAQGTKTHVLGIVIVAKRKTVTAIQPSQIGVPTLRRGSHRDHDYVAL
jgi:hypothetical protein